MNKNNMETIEKKCNPWEYMCHRWNFFTPPGRPSTNDIKNYKTLLYKSFEEKLRNKQGKFEVLLLGATPEIRSTLALDENIKVTLVDITIDMILAMTILLEEKTENEIWIRSDWVNVPLPIKYFDTILSDLVICNISPQRQQAFFTKMQSLLKDDGHWINRVYCIDENTRIRSLEELLEEYSKKDQFTRADINNFRSTAGLKHWDPETNILTWANLLKEMNKYRHNGEYKHINRKASEILNRVYKLFEPFDKKYWIGTKEQTERLFSKYFNIKKIIKDASVSHICEKGYYMYDMVKY